MSIAQPSRLAIFAGIRLAICARATSGSIGGSRARCGLVHAATSAVAASTAMRASANLCVARELFVRRDAAIRREFIDGVGQFATQAGKQLLALHAGLLD